MARNRYAMEQIISLLREAEVRLIRFRAKDVIRAEGRLPLRFEFGKYSPTLDYTGSWAQTAQAIAAGVGSSS